MQKVKIIAITEPKPTASEGRLMQTVTFKAASTYELLPNGEVEETVSVLGKKVIRNVFFDEDDEPYRLGQRVHGVIHPSVAVVPYKDSNKVVRTTKSILCLEGETLEQAAKAMGHVLRLTTPATAVPADLEAVKADAETVLEDED